MQSSSASQQAPPPCTPAVAEVGLNGAAPDRRLFLTKRANLARVEQRWGVSVLTKGRFYPPGTEPPPGTAATDNERPLFLRVAPSDPGAADAQARCDGAAQELAARAGLAPAAPPPPASHYPFLPAAPAPPSGPTFRRLYVGLPVAPPEFDAPGRLRGPGGSYLQHIAAAAAGAACELRGRGSGAAAGEGPDPLHLLLHSQDPAALIKAEECV